jgi:succinate dehydrogenase/fumarate reductase-like Fe-S protein
LSELITKCPNCHENLKNNVIKGMVVSRSSFNKPNNTQLKNFKNVFVLEEEIVRERLEKNTPVMFAKDFTMRNNYYHCISCWLCFNCGMVVDWDLEDPLLKKWNIF